MLPHSALSELFQATLDESSSFQAVEVLVEQWPRHPESAGQLTNMGRLRLDKFKYMKLHLVCFRKQNIRKIVNILPVIFGC